MTDDMIPSEATMAGCVAQSIDGYVECTCPNDAGICIDCMTNEIENLRRQLAQAQARENTALADAPPGVFLSDDDCCLLGRGLLDADEMRDHLTPEALERYRRLINRIIDVGVGEVDCPCDS